MKMTIFCPAGLGVVCLSGSMKSGLTGHVLWSSPMDTFNLCKDDGSGSLRDMPVSMLAQMWDQYIPHQGELVTIGPETLLRITGQQVVAVATGDGLCDTCYGTGRMNGWGAPCGCGA